MYLKCVLRSKFRVNIFNFKELLVLKIFLKRGKNIFGFFMIGMLARFVFCYFNFVYGYRGFRYFG